MPIRGAPEPVVDRERRVGRVALVAADYPGLRPTMQVEVGDEVRRGQLLFEDKKTPRVRYVSPAAGRVAAIHRGERRAFLSLVIELNAEEREGRAGGADVVSFGAASGKHPNTMSRSEVEDLLIESGLWTALRCRPFGKVADPSIPPQAIFVTAMDSEPLAPPMGPVLEGRGAELERGVAALAKLTEGNIYICTGAESSLQVPEGERIRHERFAGPHPAGTAGYHIHRLEPVSRERRVWYLGAQDVVAMARLFESGELPVERVVALAGPSVGRPRLLSTRIGASVDELVEGELVSGLGEHRAISGSVLSGRRAMGESEGYLGRYHQQISVLPESREREFFGWLAPGLSKFSVFPAFLSRFVPGKRFAMTTSTNGSERAIVPIGAYEKVMPMDLLPTFLLRALAMGDVERAEELGCLELTEEDLALASFVCVGKNDYGPLLREVLTTIEKEG